MAEYWFHISFSTNCVNSQMTFQYLHLCKRPGTFGTFQQLHSNVTLAMRLQCRGICKLFAAHWTFMRFHACMNGHMASEMLFFVSKDLLQNVQAKYFFSSLLRTCSLGFFVIELPTSSSGSVLQWHFMVRKVIFLNLNRTGNDKLIYQILILIFNNKQVLSL
jgi:hypothetical protein